MNHNYKLRPNTVLYICSTCNLHKIIYAFNTYYYVYDEFSIFNDIDNTFEYSCNEVLMEQIMK